MILSQRLIQLIILVIVAYMSSLKEPCPKCGCGIFQLGSRNLFSHPKYCNEIKENNNNDDNTVEEESSDKTTNPHACTDRGVWESILNTELDYSEFNNENYKGWEQHKNCGSSECGSSEGSTEDDEAHGINSKKRRYHFKKNVPIPGNVAFQIKLMEILQQHKTDTKLHDEIIHLLDHYLTTGKLNPTNPNFSSRKKLVQKVENDSTTTGLKPKHIPFTLEDGS